MPTTEAVFLSLLLPGILALLAPLRAIRILNFTGVILLAGAVSVVVYELLRTMQQP